MGKKMLQAITNLIGRWKVQEDENTLQRAMYAQYAQQMNNYAAPSWASTTTSNSTAVSGSIFGMGGAGGGGSLAGLAGVSIGSGSYTYTQSTSPAWSLTDEQLDRLLAFMERAMRYSWTCMKCQRQYAPITPDCEFCNFVERLEGEQVA